MILFEFPTQLHSEQQISPQACLAKIFSISLLKSFILACNLYFLNKNIQYLISIQIILSLFVFLSAIIALINKFAYSSQFSQDPEISQFEVEEEYCKESQGKKRILYNIVGHFFIFLNIGFLVFSIQAAIEQILSTFVFKLRLCLFCLTFQCLLSVLFFSKKSYIQSRTFRCQKSSKSITYFMVLFKKYEIFQVKALQFFLFCFTIGAFFDYFSFGTSQSSSVFLSNWKMAFNNITFYITSSFLSLYIVVVIMRKYKVINTFKDILESE